MLQVRQSSEGLRGGTLCFMLFCSTRGVYLVWTSLLRQYKQVWLACWNIRQTFSLYFCHSVSNICPLNRLIVVAYSSVPLAVTTFLVYSSYFVCARIWQNAQNLTGCKPLGHRFIIPHSRESGRYRSNWRSHLSARRCKCYQPWPSSSPFKKDYGMPKGKIYLQYH